MTPETVLLRQVHPNFMPDGQLSSQAFMPFPKDDGKLSAYNGDQITASESFQHFTQVLGFQSDSVWGVTCVEVSGAELKCAPDPLPNFPSHALIDFTAHSEKECRKLAKKLKALALERGCLYSPGNG